jgi:hypothetical protein
MSGRLKPRKEDNKYIVQVLLPSARGTYFVNHVEEKLEKQVSAFMRELIFNYVESICTEKEYKALKGQDDAEWEQAVQNRVIAKQNNSILKVKQP